MVIPFFLILELPSSCTAFSQAFSDHVTRNGSTATKLTGLGTRQILEYASRTAWLKVGNYKALVILIVVQVSL